MDDSICCVEKIIYGQVNCLSYYQVFYLLAFVIASGAMQSVGGGIIIVVVIVK